MEKQIGELEIAMDRLRSLYDQYFLGIEKLEPLVARKDVDRRIHALRKEQIRNTAQRFRFNMLIQRFNTYQTHWRGTCRAIEDGTLKRHILRARARFGVGQAEAASSDGKSPQRAPPSLAETIAAELAALDREFAPKQAWIERSTDGEFKLDSEPPPTSPFSAPGAPARPPDRDATAKLEARVRDLARGLQPAFRQGSNRPRAPDAVPQPPSRSKSSVPPSIRPPSDGTFPATPGRGRDDERAARRLTAPPSADAPPATPGRGQKLATAKIAAHPPPSPERDGLSDERVRQLYAQYLEAKRRRKESTAAITYEALARRLRESGAKLMQKHGRAVDFEVNEKDGKTILKPILK